MSSTSESQQFVWYHEVLRWGQTNLTEIDPIRYDRSWWREHWKRTQVQGVIINAGGIVAYYPSDNPLHHRAEYLGDRDLFGEIVTDAREEGLTVIARMDSNRADHRFYVEHPDWFTVDADGTPYRAGDLYIACVNSPYYEITIPEILREVIERYQPDGFADNSWSGLQRDRICYCAHCRRKFQEYAGAPVPIAHDWEDPVYRRWIRWNYDRRLEIWDINNLTTKKYGGKHCLWVGMNAGDIVAQGHHFRDHKSIAEKSQIVFLDSQSRRPGMGFQRNGEAGMLLHELMGWDRLIPESLAMYGAGHPNFRLASKPANDARLWALEAFAGTIQPWWHHIGAYHEDRRQYKTAKPLFEWHQKHERFLTDRIPIATVGLVWSQENIDYYGKDHSDVRFSMPWKGMADALIRSRIPYVPVHADNIERDCAELGLKALVLPNVGALSDGQVNAIRRFVEKGGGLVATGETSLYDEQGRRRDDFALSDVFGVSATGVHHGASVDNRKAWDDWDLHTYLRLSPERRRWVYGPLAGDEPDDQSPRHPVLNGFDDTDSIPFGGRLEVVMPKDISQTALSFIPPFPIYPPETSWMQTPYSEVPALVLREGKAHYGHVAYLAADIDRTFSRNRLPDHATVLSNVVRWSANDQIPIRVEGSGLLDCRVYRQQDIVVLHVVNLTGYETGHIPVDDYFPVGPIEIHYRAATGTYHVQHLVAGESQTVTAEDGFISFNVATIVDHEVLVLEPQ